MEQIVSVIISMDTVRWMEFASPLSELRRLFTYFAGRLFILSRKIYTAISSQSITFLLTTNHPEPWVNIFESAFENFNPIVEVEDANLA